VLDIGARVGRAIVIFVVVGISRRHRVARDRDIAPAERRGGSRRIGKGSVTTSAMMRPAAATDSAPRPPASWSVRAPASHGQVPQPARCFATGHTTNRWHL
jgi:hypothetical protein